MLLAMHRPPLLASAVLAAALAGLACGGAEQGVPLPFDGAQVASGGRAVRVAVGARPCELPARAAVVEESADKIRIRVIGQEIAADTVCTEVLESACVEIPIESELGGREVVDASGREAFLGREGVQGALQGSCRAVPARD